MKQTGIELIAQERKEQIEKHGRTVEEDRKWNTSYQLSIAAAKILAYPADVNNHKLPPTGWNPDIYKKMADKPYMERLVIAGALIAAELDRLNINDNE